MFHQVDGGENRRGRVAAADFPAVQHVDEERDKENQDFMGIETINNFSRHRTPLDCKQ
jgi:hypothetical protein